MSLASRIRETWNSWGFDVSRTAFWYGGFGRLRSFFGNVSLFRRPRAEGTRVTYDLARSLYRNDESEYCYGAGFVKPIVDGTVEMIGLPTVSSEDGDSEAMLNEAIRDYWAPQLQQAMREAIRDSKTVIRFYQPRIDNPLFTAQDRSHGAIVTIPPEEVDITFHPTDPNLITQALVQHKIMMAAPADQQVVNEPARMVEHIVIETITPEAYSYYDRTTGTDLTSWNIANYFGFVPLWPVWNEYESYLGGGQSDIEPAMPFIKAFHDVLSQSLDAHDYHSIPKVKFKVKDVDAFVANNYPEAVDPDTGKVSPNAKIDWHGREIFFFASDEDAGFIEAQSVLGDSVTLLAFLLDCICIASKTPRWALFNEGKSTGTPQSIEPYKKKIEHKRVMFTEMFVMVCKMALVANNRPPVTVRLNWSPPLLADLIAKGQAIQQLLLAFDVAASHQWMADLTIVKELAQFFTAMSAPEIEMELATNNVVAAPAPAPASSSQAQHPATTNGNGGGSTAAAQRALASLATTSASRS